MIRDDDVVYMRTVLERPLNRVLTQPHYCPGKNGNQDIVPAEFEWDGSSVPALLQFIIQRHRHPVASCRHDWRCRNAKNPEERKWADEQYRKDVGSTSWKITALAGYVGVRIGATFGVGVHYK